MMQKRAVTGTIAFLVVMLVFVGYFALAAELGSKDDPLVTISYITDVLEPQLGQKIDASIAQRTTDYLASIDTKVAEASAALDSKIAAMTEGFTGDINDPVFVQNVASVVAEELKKGDGGAGVSDGFQKVEVEAGKTITIPICSEIMLRVGNATVAAAEEPGLIDMTSGGELSNGKTLEKNHLYFVSMEKRAIKCSTRTIVFVRGTYTIA